MTPPVSRGAASPAPIDRFADVVVGSGGESRELVLVFAQRREEDDHRVFQFVVLAQAAAGFEPVHAGHHPVEQDQMRMHFECAGDPFGAVAGGEHFVTFALEVVADEFEDVVFVVDQKNAVTHNR